jgi:intracellular sulfur oxidation DsrE/DsrF family protein
MKKILLPLIALTISLLAEAPSAKSVYDLTTKDLKVFERKILKSIVANKAYYESKLQELDVTVVIHGEAYRYFLKDLSHTKYKTDKALISDYVNLKKRIKSMSDTYDVKFLMCGVGVKKHKIEEKNILNFVKVIPNSTIGLIDAQNAGYAYIPVGDE